MKTEPHDFQDRDQLLEAVIEENMRLKAALLNLVQSSGHISPLGGEASVKAVRRAAKYIEALEAAQKELEG